MSAPRSKRTSCVEGKSAASSGRNPGRLDTETAAVHAHFQDDKGVPRMASFLPTRPGTFATIDGDSATLQLDVKQPDGWFPEELRSKQASLLRFLFGQVLKRMAVPKKSFFKIHLVSSGL